MLWLSWRKKKNEKRKHKKTLIYPPFPASNFWRSGGKKRGCCLAFCAISALCYIIIHNIFFFFFFFTGFLPCFRIFCFLYLCGSPPVNRLGPRSAVAVVVSVVMFVCSTQVRRETLGLIGVCFSKVWLLFYSCGLPLNGSASPFTTKIGGNIQAAQISPHYVAVEPCYVAPWPDCDIFFLKKKKGEARESRIRLIGITLPSL